ncbi:tRNA lysidine(34) synthetase TilS [Evansella halocellulosilytica]|uniref:tRNA lysidine(34) synthetase TilS n=1 Tax=Evansella halocellulosilytica TaxID=2011013 RepID=UPI000BB884EA|nr:tRNA lysidine(34) synthetase TilS [Evansella halocellulosilytica]
MNPTINTVKSFILKHELVSKNDHIMIAVSGGPDSIALLHFFYHHYRGDCKLSVGHVEHGLRGSESVEDLHFVKQICSDLGVPFYSFRGDVAAVKEAKGVSTQEAAREVRYTWFYKKMDEISANKIAFGHHGDDQIETVMMRQVRGSYDGLKGMPVKRHIGNKQLIRPLLCLNKKQVIDYCDQNDLSYRIDSSNEKDDYQRNRFRNNVLPFIQSENPNAHTVFQKQSEWLTDDFQLLEQLAEKALHESLQKKDPQEVILCKERFLHIPISLQRRVLHLILNYLSVNVEREISSDHIEDLVTFIHKQNPSGSLHLPDGIRVRKSYDDCIFSDQSFMNKKKQLPLKKISVPGMIRLDQGKITAEIMKKGNQLSHEASVFLADYEKLVFPLYVRSRQSGDRISPIGMNGSKKIKDLFIDHKVPHSKRDEWPIITDENGNVLWVPSLKRSKHALIDENTEKILVLRYDLENHVIP